MVVAVASFSYIFVVAFLSVTVVTNRKSFQDRQVQIGNWLSLSIMFFFSVNIFKFMTMALRADKEKETRKI